MSALLQGLFQICTIIQCTDFHLYVWGGGGGGGGVDYRNCAVTALILCVCACAVREHV